MKTDDKAAWRPQRFDVAGAHPDEAWRAVSNIAEAVKELGREVSGAAEEGKITLWLSKKPLRFGKVPDGDVQWFLERGVKLMEELKDRHPLGLSERQREVRARCDELAKAMQRVLERRPDEALPFDPWRKVKIAVEAATPQIGNNMLLPMETRQRYRAALKGCFVRGPAEANRARTQYRIWEQNGERFQKDGPMNEAAQSWKRFMGVIDNMRSREQAKGVVWGRVDDVNGIDFTSALTQRPIFNRKPGMRM
jgi:hypothetical protein